MNENEKRKIRQTCNPLRGKYKVYTKLALVYSSDRYAVVTMQ
jgi:hypothetical protein